jgi:hypothetical protein
VFAGLKGVSICQRYLDLIQKKVVEPLGIELRRAAGLAGELDQEVRTTVWLRASRLGTTAR